MNRQCDGCRWRTQKGHHRMFSCNHIKVGKYIRSERCYPDSLIIDAIHGERIATGPNFGCGHWTPKPGVVQQMANDAKKQPIPSMSEEKLQALMDYHGLSQPQLAALVGVSRQRVHSWLQGESNRGRKIPSTVVVALRALGLVSPNQKPDSID
jgi:DNA-binding transcriptional regulator YiaG